MPAVREVSAHLSSITAPSVLASRRCWLLWRYEHLAGEKKARKIPYYTSGARRFGKQGGDIDRAKLTTFSAAKQAAIRRGFDGVGIAALEGSGITIIDFDNCVTTSGLDPAVEDAAAGTYAEYSPSGNGIHAIVLGELGDRKDHSTGFETFSSKGFCTFTGARTELTEMLGDDITAPSETITRWCAERFGCESGEKWEGEELPVGLTEDQIAKCLEALDPSMAHDDWLHVGMALHHETQGDGFQLWDNWSQGGAQYPSREALEARWNSFGQSGHRPVTARTLLKMTTDAGADVGYGVASPDDFDVVAEPVAPPGGHFKIRSAADFVSQVQTVSWLIKGVLPKAQMGVIFGESGSGKSFLAFDICAALSRGVAWNEKRTVKARVLYVVAEGVGGFNLRVQAYCARQGIKPQDLDIDIISDVVPNLGEQSHAANLIADIKHCGPYDLIVMDTLAQVTPGANENSGEDMGKALAHCRKISQASGAMVLLVHHSGKDASKGARGWSGLRAAADVELEVTRLEDYRELTVTKLKDGQDGAQFGFKLDTVALWDDEDGDPVSSCVVEYHAQGVKRPRAKLSTGPKGANERLALSVVHDITGLDPDCEVQQTALIDRCVSQMVHDGAKRDRRRELAMRAVENLGNSGHVRISEGVVRLPGADDG